MARRFITHNVIIGQAGLSRTFAHGLGARPEEWTVLMRFISQSRTRHPRFLTANTTSINVACSADGTPVTITTQRGDIFAWINHSIVE